MAPKLHSQNGKESATHQMACLLLILITAFPRIALILLFLFTTFLQRAYHTILVPLLGFIFLPLTTIVYAWLVNNALPITGINVLWIVIAVLIDAGGWGGGYQRRRW